MAAEDVFIGYNFCGAVHGTVIPQRLQNLCIRDYARGKGFNITFSVSEYTDPQRSLMLFAQFEFKDRVLSGLVFFSLLLLPVDPVRRKDFYTRVLAAKVVVHFALEDLVLSTAQDAAEMERLYCISVDKRLI
ncbi:MAG: hypothetical protein HY074_07965, partial [Deltaproteobacteria bacterium]|nr:hypothetical protein [Deltaproteobacteria bacterium]